ncbi:transposase [Candidatus Fermentibacteria bacterium]|nr:transposase [Candidatus Fermentibacteria bacterium]
MVENAHCPRRKQIRLDAPAYAVPGTVFHVTVCCRDHAPLLSDVDTARVIRETLMSGDFAGRWDLYAFAIMPDHVHLLIGVSEWNLVRAIAAWKSQTTRRLWARGHSGSVWQRSFHDHGLRQQESAKDVAEYIVANPERAGLPERTQFVWHRWMAP